MTKEKQVDIELCIAFKATKLLLELVQIYCCSQLMTSRKLLVMSMRSDMCRDIFHALFEAKLHWERGCFLFFFIFGAWDGITIYHHIIAQKSVIIAVYHHIFLAISP